MSKEMETIQKYRNTILLIIILFAISLTAYYKYVLFHSIAELFSIAIAGGIFIVGWNSQKYAENTFFIIIGISYLFIAFLDLIHTLGYAGMNIFLGYDSNLPSSLWIVARYLQAISILIALLFRNKKVNRNFLIIGYFAISIIFTFLIFFGYFPACYIEGFGLTPFKIISEYIIILIFSASIFYFYKYRREFEKKLYKNLAFSIGLTIISELFFTLYIGVYDLPNLLGHLFKIVAFYLIYRSIIVSGVEDPLNVLFRRLKLNEENLRRKTKDLEQINVFLKEAELRYRTTFEQSPDGIMIIDPNRLKAIEFNDVMCNLLGYSRKELTMMKIYDYDMNNDEKDIKAHIQTTFRYGSDDYETKFITKSGRIKDVFVKAKLITLGGNKYIQSIYRDITEGKKIQQQIEEERKKYADLIRNIPNVIYSSLPDEIGTTTFLSERWKEWTGVKPEEHYNDKKAWLNTLHPDDRNDTQKRFIEAITDRKDYDLEYRVIHRDTDEIFYLRDQGVPIVDKTGNIIRYDGIISNITARKKAEEKLEHFVSTVSHELKNPIAVLILSLNYISKYKDDITKEQENKLLEGIMRNVNLLNQLVNDLLTLSRMDEKRMILDWKVYSPLEIMNDNLNLMEPSLKSKNISIDLDINPDIFLYGDIARINQIFRILIDNAWKYSNEGSSVTIKAIEHYSGKYNSDGIDGILFQFIDSGIGIHPKDLPFIFDRFFRASTVNHIPGTGLGLTIAKELTELHNGKIFVESEYGKGTTFLLFLPKVQIK